MTQKFRKLWLPAWTFGLICLVAGVWLASSFERRYEGVPVQSYVRQILTNGSLSFEETFKRIKPMGAKLAVPALTKIAQVEGSPSHQLYLQFYLHSPAWIRKRLSVPRSNAAIVYKVLNVLGRFGPEAKAAVPTLVRMLQRSNDISLERLQWQGQSGAAFPFLSSDHRSLIVTLGEIGPAAREALPIMLSLATSTNDAYSRSTAIAASVKIDPAGNATAEALGRLLEDHEFTIRRTAAEALGNMEATCLPATTNLTLALRDPLLQVRQTAARGLQRRGTLTEADLRQFFLAMGSPQAKVRADAASMLNFSRDFAESVPLLLDAADDLDSAVRKTALETLSHLARQSDVLTGLRFAAAKEVLRQGSDNDSWSTIEMLRSLPTTASNRVALAATALRHKSERVRAKAARTLADMGSVARDAEPELREALKDEWLNVREAAADALRNIGSEVSKPAKAEANGSP